MRFPCGLCFKVRLYMQFASLFLNTTQKLKANKKGEFSTKLQTTVHPFIDVSQFMKGVWVKMHCCCFKYLPLNKFVDGKTSEDSLTISACHPPPPVPHIHMSRSPTLNTPDIHRIVFINYTLLLYIIHSLVNMIDRWMVIFTIIPWEHLWTTWL